MNDRSIIDAQTIMNAKLVLHACACQLSLLAKCSANSICQSSTVDADGLSSSLATPSMAQWLVTAWLTHHGWRAQFYEDVCLVDQRFVIDDALRIREVLKGAVRDGSPLRVASFVRLQCGEGLEQLAPADFAGEVKQAVQAAAG